MSKIDGCTWYLGLCMWYLGGVYYTRIQKNIIFVLRCKQDVSLSESLLRAHRSDVIGEVLINVESYHIVHQTNSIS